MACQFDGGYAEYAMVPAGQVRTLRTDLPWAKLGALPEMLQTAWGALFLALRFEPGQRLLIRGGTMSVGLAAASIAKAHGAKVAVTSRQPQSEPLVSAAGCDLFFVDDGSIAGAVRKVWDGGADKVLELIGTTTLADSLQCVREAGSVCMGRHGGRSLVFLRLRTDGRHPQRGVADHVFGRCRRLHGHVVADADRQRRCRYADRSTRVGLTYRRDRPGAPDHGIQQGWRQDRRRDTPRKR